MKEILIGSGLTILLGFVSSLLISLLKKGDFENYGKIAGRWISKIGSIRFGKSKWESLEDILTLSFISFANGVRIGASEDDSAPEVAPQTKPVEPPTDPTKIVGQ